MSGRVIVVGSFNVDHVWSSKTLPQGGETLIGDYHSGAGGKGFNQAIACARAGATTSFVCALGDDAGAAMARDMASHDGITLIALPATAPTGTAGIFVDAEGRNSIIIGAGANAALSVTHVEAQTVTFEQARVVLAQCESPLDSVVSALRLGRGNSALTVLNPAPANAPTSRELLALADILTPNETEFATLLARHTGEDVDADTLHSLDDARLHALCRELHAGGSVVITLGARGCFASHARTALHGDVDACYRVAAVRADVVDTTGAGDAFNGALAASLAIASSEDRQIAFRQHLQFASRYAAASTEHAGAARAMPRLGDLRSHPV